MSTLSELRSSIGKGEPELQAILSAVVPNVMFSGPDTRVRVWGKFDRHLFPVRHYPDALIDCLEYGSGVLLVQGGIHATKSHARKGGKDDRAREDYEKLGLWVEELTPSQAKDPEAVEAALERHRVVRDEYGGVTSQ